MTTFLRTTSEGIEYTGNTDGYFGSAMWMVAGGPGGGSWIWDRLPDNSAPHPQSATSVAFMRGVIDKRGVYINNGGSYGVKFYVARQGTSKKKFVLLNSGDTELAAVLDRGIPIPDENFVIDNDQGQWPDSTFEVYLPDYDDGDPDGDTLWSGFVTRPPGHPEGHPAYWSVQHGGRWRNASQRINGHSVNINGNAAVVERPYWMASGSHLSMSLLAYTVRDWNRKLIDHVLGFLMPGYAIPGQEGSYAIEPAVWPATGADASSRPQMPMGGRYRIKRSYMTDAQIEAIPDVNLRMWVRQGVHHGFVHYDSDSYYVKSENGIYIPGEPDQPLIWRSEEGTGIFPAGYPWDQVERIAQGSDALFTPVV